MKLIIELDDDIAKGIRGENECEVEPREIVRSFQATIADAVANGTPYNPTQTGDCISRNAVIRMFNTMDRYKADKLILQDTDEEFPKNEVFIVDDCYEQLGLIDNAPTVEPERTQGNQITWEHGYECGYHQAKEDAIRRIAEQYSAHHELIPKWLSIGDMKGGAE